MAAQDLSPQRALRNTEEIKNPHPLSQEAAKEGWGILELLSQAEFGVELGLGVVAGPDVELLGLNHPLLQCRAPELEFVGAELEMDGLLRAGLKR
jgi:hypothetical protein